MATCPPHSSDSAGAGAGATVGKVYAGAADGTAWSEGAGVVVGGWWMHGGWGIGAGGLVRGSAIGTRLQRTRRQWAIPAAGVRAALARWKLRPVEWMWSRAQDRDHAGDPIEAQSALATYGQDRVERLWLGRSIEHRSPSAAAGWPGDQMVQAMRHGVMQDIACGCSTPHVDWSVGAVSLLTQPAGVSVHGRPRRAGVSRRSKSSGTM